jgi:two-component sensor histidine kinase
MLALVQVMLRQTHAETVRDYAAAAQGRVAALARAQTLLSQSRWEGADLGRLIEEGLAPFRRTDDRRVQIEGPPVALAPPAAQSFAMVLHELATNAAIHGALSVPQGRVSVEWTWHDEQLVLRWTETGGPPVQAPTRRGLGTSVIERSIRDQLNGTVRFDWRPAGLVCELVVPASTLTRPTG